jgi:hypothetical protein
MDAAAPEGSRELIWRLMALLRRAHAHMRKNPAPYQAKLMLDISDALEDQGKNR